MSISRDQLPTQNFTVDEIESKGYNRAEVIITLQRMQKEGLGTFTIGRRGGKSRWEWTRAPSPMQVLSTLSPPLADAYKPQPAVLSVRPSVPVPMQAVPIQDQTKEILQAFANITAFKGNVSLDALKQHIDGLMKELFKLRENVVVEEPPGIDHIEYNLLSEEQAVFWTWKQRQKIAAELRAYRKGK